MVNNAFRCTPLAVLSILFGLVFIIFGFLYFYFFLWLQVLLVSFTPTYVFSYFWLKINSVLSVSSRVTSYSLQWILENKFYICSPCRACFFFLPPPSLSQVWVNTCVFLFLFLGWWLHQMLQMLPTGDHWFRLHSFLTAPHSRSHSVVSICTVLVNMISETLRVKGTLTSCVETLYAKHNSKV